MLMRESPVPRNETRTEGAPAQSPSRKLHRSPIAIEAALRKIVYDYVAGWGIVLTQSPKERRRKKRIWNRRTAERQAFSRPVWVHKAQWTEAAAPEARSVIVHHSDEMYLVRDVSSRGIGLTSDRSPKSRLVVLEFDFWKGKPVELVVYLRWRRRVGTQDYRCGGTLLGVLLPE